MKSISSEQDCLDLLSELNAPRNALSTFCGKNQLYSNSDECRVITFSRNINKIIYPYNLENTVLSRVDNIKDLGVVFDSKLIFDLHIDQLASFGLC